MLIYILRHGIAHDREAPDCPADPERALTDRGVSRTRAAVDGMAALGIAAEAVLTSPYVRARQTATIARDGVARGTGVVELDALEPGGDLSAVCEAIAATGANSVMCVGHAPDLDELLAHLVGAPAAFTHLKKAGLACVDTDSPESGNGLLVAVHPPRALRRLARLQANSLL